MDTRPTSPWFTAIVSCAILAVGSGAVLVKLHETMMADIQSAMDEQNETVETLRNRLSVMEAEHKALAAKQAELAKPDTAPIDALKAELANSNATIVDLTARLEALESKQAAPAPVAPAVPTAAPAPALSAFAALRTAVMSGKPYAAELIAAKTAHPDMLARPELDARAEQGVPTEAALRAALQAVLTHAEAPALPVRDRSTMGRINDYFAGYISIKKKGERDPYAPLRSSAPTASIATLSAMAEALSEPARAPLAAWIADAHFHIQALSALDTLPDDTAH